MVLVKSKSKSITKQKQKQRQTVIVNIDTKKTRSKRQPRKLPKKPSLGAGNSDIATNQLYYPSVIHAVQQVQPLPDTMIKDAVREAVRNIHHASTKDQYIEQIQHQPVKPTEAKGEQPAELPIQPELQPQMPDLQQPAPIANLKPISILAEPAQRIQTPIETPKENESKIVQYVGKAREREASDNRKPYLQPVNAKSPELYNPFEGVGLSLDSQFVKPDKQTLKQKMLEAAEERLQKNQIEQLAVIANPEPIPKEQSKEKILQQLNDYKKTILLQIAKDNKIKLEGKERSQSKDKLSQNLARRLNPKTVNWDLYPKLKGKK